MDEIADLADRMTADAEFEFEIEWGALTGAERDELIALLDERIAHRAERLEHVTERNRALKALLVLNVQRAPGMTLPEAIGSGHIGIMELVETINGAVADPTLD